jgi:hypothetical protein
MARTWAGRIAVTEHIPDLSAYELPDPRSRQEGHADPGRGFWVGLLGWLMAVDKGIAWSLHGRSRSVPGSMPLGGPERPRRAVRFARLLHRRDRVLGGPPVRAACGGNLKPALVAT